jgi:hypothetical protein
MAVHTARHGRQIRNLRHALGYPASTVGLAPESAPRQEIKHWRDGRLLVRIPKMKPSSVLHVAWEECQRSSGILPTTLGLPALE